MILRKVWVECVVRGCIVRRSRSSRRILEGQRARPCGCTYVSVTLTEAKMGGC